ncbi:MAP kinase kinase kinase mkh1 [Fusarium oxysporum f. sp. albedinis]|nr:MAP kinase kinase kinase mkh1 [Fusarium oxysporum f. sp. albedinis]
MIRAGGRLVQGLILGGESSPCHRCHTLFFLALASSYIRIFSTNHTLHGSAYVRPRGFLGRHRQREASARRRKKVQW